MTRYCSKHPAEKMTLLFTSYVCDVCDPPAGVSAKVEPVVAVQASVHGIGPANAEGLAACTCGEDFQGMSWTTPPTPLPWKFTAYCNGGASFKGDSYSLQGLVGLRCALQPNDPFIISQNAVGYRTFRQLSRFSGANGFIRCWCGERITIVDRLDPGGKWLEVACGAIDFHMFKLPAEALNRLRGSGLVTALDARGGFSGGKAGVWSVLGGIWCDVTGTFRSGHTMRTLMCPCGMPYSGASIRAHNIGKDELRANCSTTCPGGILAEEQVLAGDLIGASVIHLNPLRVV